MSRSKRSPRRLAAVLMLGVLTAGCSNGDLATVNGVVQLDGSPLECGQDVLGTVVYQNKDGGPKAVGTIDDDGRYEVQVGSSRYVEPGAYLVSVTAKQMIPSNDPNYPPRMQSTIPARYATSRTSGLEFDIVAGGNDVVIELSSP